MSETAEKLAETLLALPETDRLALANMLFDSLPAPPGIMSEDDPGFEEELDRRLRDHESGKSKGIPADEFFRKLRENRAKKSDEEWEVQWANECNRRLDELEAGQVKLIPAEEAIQKLKEKYG